MKEGAEEHEVWEKTNTWPHCFRDRAELALNGDIEGHSAILTSDVQAIRQKLCGTQQNRDKHVSVSVGEGQSP